MTSIFLENYSLSEALTFKGVAEHYASFSQEKAWNARAIVHLTLSILHICPLIYILEGFFSTLLDANPKENTDKAPLPILPEKVTLKTGTIFGTKNQYTCAKNDEERQSCTVQTLTFLRCFFQSGKVDGPMIDRCLEEGLQIFIPLSQKLQKTRRDQARTYLIKQGVPEQDIDQFLHDNPGSLKEYPLTVFLEQYIHLDTSFAVQLLSGHSVTVKEATQAFLAELKEISDFSAKLPVAEKERMTLFTRKLPENQTGIVLTCNGMTILVAKTESHYVIYDSHSNTALHPDNPSAYVKTTETPQETATFLATLFEHRIGGTNQIEMMTFAPQRSA